MLFGEFVDDDMFEACGLHELLAVRGFTDTRRAGDDDVGFFAHGLRRIRMVVLSWNVFSSPLRRAVFREGVRAS